MLIRRAPGELTYPLVSASKYRNRNLLPPPRRDVAPNLHQRYTRIAKLLVFTLYYAHRPVGAS